MGKMGKKSIFSLHTIKNSVFFGSEEKIRLGSEQSIQGYGESWALALSVGLTGSVQGSRVRRRGQTFWGMEESSKHCFK